MSPELVSESSYNSKSDIWALGCLIYELCALECVSLFDDLPFRPPFQAKTQEALASRIQVGNPPQLPSIVRDTSGCDLYELVLA